MLRLTAALVFGLLMLSPWAPWIPLGGVVSVAVGIVLGLLKPRRCYLTVLEIGNPAENRPIDDELPLAA